jgi:hypothetical protein
MLAPKYQTLFIVFTCLFAGTHWVWEMCQMLIKGNPEYHHKSKESCMLEFHLADEFKTIKKPRVFNTHMTPKCLPQKILHKKCKVIYLQRNPKDIITSTYHHMKQTKLSLDPSTTWSHFLSEYIFKNGKYRWIRPPPGHTFCLNIYSRMVSIVGSVHHLVTLFVSIYNQEW